MIAVTLGMSSGVMPEQSVVVTVCPDGPLLVRGQLEVVGTGGDRAAPPRRTLALCRCGASGAKPWCDGSHKVVGFRG